MFDHLIAERLQEKASAAASEPRYNRCLLPPMGILGLLGAGYAHGHRRPLSSAEWERINQVIAPIKARHLARKSKGSR